MHEQRLARSYSMTACTTVLVFSKDMMGTSCYGIGKDIPCIEERCATNAETFSMADLGNRAHSDAQLHDNICAT